MPEALIGRKAAGYRQSYAKGVQQGLRKACRKASRKAYCATRSSARPRSGSSLDANAPFWSNSVASDGHRQHSVRLLH